MNTRIPINILFGGAGFIGTNLAIALTKKSQLIIVVDLFGALNWDLLNDFPSIYQIRISKQEDIRPRVKNLIDHLIKNQIDEFEIVFWHLAANSDIASSSDDVTIDIENTLKSTVLALNIISELPCLKVFIFASTSAVYGFQPGIRLTEDSRLSPISNYGIMKLASELLIQCQGRTSQGFRHFIFRFPNVIGPYLTHGLIYDLRKQVHECRGILKILGNGNQTKQYMHVNDLIESMLFLVQHSQDSMFNLGPASGTTSVREIVQLFQDINQNSWKVEYGTEPYGWIGDVPSFEFSIDKALESGVMITSTSIDSVKIGISQNLVK